MKRIEKYKDDLIQVMDQTGLSLKEAIQEINKDIKTDKDVLSWLDGEFKEFKLTQNEHDLLQVLYFQGFASIQRSNRSVFVCNGSQNRARRKQVEITGIADGMFEFLETGEIYQIEYLVLRCKIMER